jgi:hypothetical protein
MIRVRRAPSAALLVGAILGFGAAACGLIAGVSDLPYPDANEDGGALDATSDTTIRDAASTDSPLDVGANDVAAPQDASEAACLPATVTGPCTPFPQTGCGAGQNCEVPTSGVGACFNAGSTPQWSNCFGSSNACATGEQCIGEVCKPYCCSAADCTGGLVTCEQVTGPDGGPLVGAKVCASGCDPVDASAICGPAVTCDPFPWDGTGHDHGDCLGGVGTGLQEAGCTGYADCAPGFECVTSRGYCAAWCRMDNPVCPSPLTCKSFSSPPIIGGVEYGVCL